MVSPTASPTSDCVRKEIQDVQMGVWNVAGKDSPFAAVEAGLTTFWKDVQAARKVQVSAHTCGVWCV
jgi:hypothetical protein